MPGSFRKFLLFSVVLLLGVAALLYYADKKRVENLNLDQREAAEYAVNQASALIAQEIIQLQRSVNLFVLSARQQIDTLITDFDDEYLRATILDQVKQHFPGAFTFTITDTAGDPLLVDSDHFIGDQCRDNLKAFAASTETDLRIHASSGAYHFDIMAPMSHSGGEGVFFISFHAGTLSRYLQAPPGHELILVRKGNDNMIELTADGSRGHLQRVSFLNDSETASIQYSKSILGTGWELVDIIRGAPGAAGQFDFHSQSLSIFLVFMLVTLVALFAIYFDDLRLDRAMRALEEHRRKLEERIKFRTEELTEANRELHRLSTRDSLTGVANRRHFDSEITREVHRTRRIHQPLSLLMIDVDFFKAFNDSLGHPAGDRCLKEVAKVLSDNVHRSSDFIARYGGEEFVIVLPGVDKEHAARFAENLLHQVEAEKIDHPASPVSAFVTISVGVATLPRDSTLEAGDLLEAADQSLYAAKNNGRNRVEWYPQLQIGAGEYSSRNSA